MKKTKTQKRDLEFIYEMGSLRFIERAWKRYLNPDFQNLAEHHLRVAWIALVLANKEGVKNTDKVLKFAIMHDIAESRTGDVDYLSRQYAKRDEDLGMKDILKDTVLEEEFLKLWEEYKDKKTLESQIVKDADTLDVDLELMEQDARGMKVRSIWGKGRTTVASHFYTKSAKELWKSIQKSNPHDWHTNGRNRFNDGDWKDKK